MVIPLGPVGGGLQQDEECPQSVKEGYRCWWWLLLGLFAIVSIGRAVAADVPGALISVIMAVCAWYMVSNNCQKMSQYCILMFGFLCLMNAILEVVQLLGFLGGRQTSYEKSTPQIAGKKTSYTITVEKHPFFDEQAGFLYNHQSAMMIVAPTAAFVGFCIAYMTYNAFPTSMFAEEGGEGFAPEARNFGGGRLGGGYGGGGYGGGDQGQNGGGRAFQTGRQQPQATLWAGTGQRLGGNP